MSKRTLNFNIKLLIIEPDKEHSHQFISRLQEAVPILGHDYASSIQSALEAHIAQSYDLCLVSQAYPNKEISIFLRDIQKLYSQDRQRLCPFIQYCAVLPKGFDPKESLQIGFSSVISEKLEQCDIDNIKTAIEDVAFVNQLNEHMNDVDWTMKMILKEVDRVSRERKRGREVEFNKIPLHFAADLVEFDPRVLSKYFETLSEQTEKRNKPGPSLVKIPAKVLERNLPKLLEDRYSGASSRVWNKLLKKYGLPEEPR